MDGHYLKHFILVFSNKRGRIIQHRDIFSFWKWSFMALGPIGLVLGWSPIIRKKVQQRAFRGLDKFIRSEL